MKLAGWSCSDSFYSEAVLSTAVAEPPFDNDFCRCQNGCVLLGWSCEIGLAQFAA